jgi:hypothetical protein
MKMEHGLFIRNNTMAIMAIIMALLLLLSIYGFVVFLMNIVLSMAKRINVGAMAFVWLSILLWAIFMFTMFVNSCLNNM